MIKLKDGFSGERSVVLPPMVVDAQIDDPLTSSLYVIAMGYYPHACHHYCSREDCPIDQYVLIYCVDGNGWYRIGNQEIQQVHKDEFFILPANVSHVYGADDGDSWTIYWVHFNGRHAPTYAEGVHTPQHINVTVDSRIGHRNNLFEEIMTTLMEGRDINSLRYASSLLHYYLATMRYLKQYREANKRESSFSINPVPAAIHYMEENIERKLPMDDILHYVGYSQSHFTELFRKETGQSPHSYFNSLKVKEACKLLIKTDMKINQICFKLGIEDCYYFSRLFTKQMGLSPQKYRDKHKQ